MKTLHLDSELYGRAAEAAAEKGITVEEYVGEALRHVLSSERAARSVRNGIPIMVVDRQVRTIDPAVIRRNLEEEGF